MKFVDEAKIVVQGWTGWKGSSSWRREKYVAYGWPDGWDGWIGWSVYAIGDESQNTLADFSFKKEFRAKDGQAGWSQWMHWADWEDIFLKMPLWTNIYIDEELVASIQKPGEKFRLVQWGRGGWWNIHFKSSTAQFPNFAMNWELGKKATIKLELQIGWDIGLLWAPNAWKSSLLAKVSNAKPDIAAYPFTTIIPNLGVTKEWKIILDVPWIIEGASNWKWLGLKFLKHSLKSDNWLFMVDGSDKDQIFQSIQSFEEILKYLKDRFDNAKISLETKDWIFLVLESEKAFLKKKINFCINKIDIESDVDAINEIFQTFSKISKEFFWLKISKKIIKENSFSISLAENKNLEKLDEYISSTKKLGSEFFVAQKQPNLDYCIDITDIEREQMLQDDYDEKDVDGRVWEVANKELAYYVYVLPWGNAEAEMWFWKRIEQDWLLKWLIKHWAEFWDVFKVISPYREWDFRYIKWD